MKLKKDIKPGENTLSGEPSELNIYECFRLICKHTEKSDGYEVYINKTDSRIDDFIFARNQLDRVIETLKTNKNTKKE